MPKVYRDKQVMEYNEAEGALESLEANGWSANKPTKAKKPTKAPIEEPKE